MGSEVVNDLPKLLGEGWLTLVIPKHHDTVLERVDRKIKWYWLTRHPTRRRSRTVLPARGCRSIVGCALNMAATRVRRPLNADQLRSRLKQKPSPTKKNNNRHSHLQAIANSFRATTLLSKRHLRLRRRSHFTRRRGFPRCLAPQRATLHRECQTLPGAAHTSVTMQRVADRR